MWISNKIIRDIKKRNRIWKKYKNTSDLSTLYKYKEVRNKISSDIVKAKRNFEIRLANNINENSKAFYAYVNSKRISKDKIGPLKDENGQIATDNEAWVTH